MRGRCLATALMLVLLFLACGGESPSTRPPTAARQEPALAKTGQRHSKHVVGAVIWGARRDFRESTSPAWFERCFLLEFRAELTAEAVSQLVAIKRSAGEPAAAIALNRAALPAADRCGRRHFVPELVGAASAL